MRAHLEAGILAGVFGLLTFLIIHHFWILPIWFILPLGLVIAALGGLAVGWSYAELHSALPPRPWTAPAIVVLVFAILAPAIVLAQLRAPLIFLGEPSLPPADVPRIAIEFLLELVVTALVTGSAAGWVLGHSPRAALATGVAGVVYAFGPGHNIPFLGNTPASGKGLALLLAITVIAAIVLVEATAWLQAR
jgi:hypothetical protein